MEDRQTEKRKRRIAERQGDSERERETANKKQR